MSDFDARALLVKRLGEDYVRTLRAGCVRAGEDAHAAGFCEGDSAGFKRGVEACKEKVRSLFPTHGDAARYDSPVKNSLALVIQVLDEDLLGKEPS